MARLPPVTVPVPDIVPPVARLPPVTVPVELTVPPVAKLPPVIVPVVLKLVPVAAPMLGVVRFAPALTEIFPLPSKAVVLSSTLALNTVPTKLKPAAVLAV